MAFVFQLQEANGTIRYDFQPSGGGATYKMLYVTGTRMEYPAQNGLMVETFDLCSISSITSTRIEVTKIQQALDDAVEWHTNPSKNLSIWLVWNIDGESAKRALIYDYELPLNAVSTGLSKALDRGELNIKVAITRGPWERVTAIETADILSAGTTPAYGGAIAIPAAHVKGDIDGRIELLEMQTSLAFTTSSYERIWAGIREVNQGYTGFVPVWNIENATLTPSSDTVSGTLAGSVGTNVKVTSFTTYTAMQQRWHFLLSQHITATGVAADQYDYIGEYEVLLRYQITLSGEIGVRIGTHQSSTITRPASYNETQYLSDTGGSWRFAEMGTVKIPIVDYRYSYSTGIGFPDGTLQNFAFSFDAEIYSGTGTLYCDTLLLIPSRNYIRLDDQNLGFPGVATQIITNEDDTGIYYTINGASNMIGNASFSPENWKLPYEGGVIVIAAERPTAQVSTDTLEDIRLISQPRYANYRND